MLHVVTQTSALLTLAGVTGSDIKGIRSVCEPETLAVSPTKPSCVGFSKAINTQVFVALGALLKP